MKFILILSIVLSSTLAAPTAYTTSQAFSNPALANGALRHLNQLNDDGSYTFGYENIDGSFRMEHRDVNGFVQGRYGFVDPNGELHETDYVAGQTLGFQSRNGQSPATSQWPVIHTASHASSQRAQDFEYSSVDDNQDGIPDNLQGNTRLTSVVVPQTVNVAPTRIQTASQLVNVAPITTTNTQNVVRVVETAPAAVQTPFTVGGFTTDNIRLSVQQPAPVVTNNVRLTSVPLRQQQQHSVIRTEPTSSFVQHQPIRFQQQSVVPTSFVVQEQPTFTNFGGHQLGGFIRNVQQPAFTNLIRNPNIYGGHQQLHGGVQFANTLLGNAAY